MSEQRKRAFPDALGATAAVTREAVRSASSVRSATTWEHALGAVLDDLAAAPEPDLALVFIDTRFAAYYSDILARLHAELAPRALAGCTAQAVVGAGYEAEGEPAITVLALHLPGVRVTPVGMVGGDDPATALEEVRGASAASWLVFADPFTVQVESLIAALEQRAPGATLLGGLASAHGGGRQTAVFMGDRVHEGGAVLVGLDSALRVEPLVAQGAEPFGDPWTITDCEEHLVRTIGNRPALEVLVETLEALDPETRERAQRNLLVGLAIDEYRDSFERGDYLIRNLVGADRDTGAIAVNEHVRAGQTIQFQFRDARAADEDLRQRLDAWLTSGERERVVAAVLCTCNGRGRDLFGTGHHDAAALAATLGNLPVAGLFCNGEIGPVGGRTYLHGFTASIGLLTLSPG